MNSSSGPPTKQILPGKFHASDTRKQPRVENEPRPKTSTSNDSDVICARCKARKSGRNLVVCFDGTSNQFGENNTNVVELYHRIIKDDDERQLTYYNSGIGTYARPSWRSVKYLKQVLTNKIDLAIAWNFETIILKGYRWLADKYKTGDQIFLFGFSRGAYQVRALAAMIEKVGLILPGNEEQIPFAYELYADLKSHNRKSEKISSATFDIAVKIEKNFLKKLHKKSDKETSSETFDMAARFKETFSRKDVKVHFVGNWDAVSSIGLFRGKTLPGVDKYEHICYFRHALALDERRVKFLPEYICGGDSADEGTSSRKAVHVDTVVTGVEGTLPKTQYSNANASVTTDVVPKSTVPRVKEVWFSGSHSDIGGGIVSNTELNNAAIPVLWMGNEALMAGLKLSPSKVEWDWKKLKESTPTNSLSFIWRCLEFLPIERLTYTDWKATTWWPHLARGRVIKPGQKIHASVAFMDYSSYKPKAQFADGMTHEHWFDIIGEGRYHRFDWVSGPGDLLERDLFDLSVVSELFNRLNNEEVQPDISGRLRFISLSDEGARKIMTADPDLKILLRMLGNDIAEIRIDGRDILAALCGHEFSFIAMEKLVNHHGLADFTKLVQGNSEVSDREKISATNLLRKLCEHPRLRENKIRVGFDTVMYLARLALSQESKSSLSIFQALEYICGRARGTDEVLQNEIERFTAAGDEAVQIAAAWMITMLVQSPEIRVVSDEKVFSRILSMLQSKSYPVKASAAHLLGNFWSNDTVLTATSKDENIALLCELLSNDPSEWTDGILRVFEAFTRREMFRQAVSGKQMVDRLKGMLVSNTTASRMAERLLGIFSEYREFEQVILGILPQLETMLQNSRSEPRELATRLLVDISRHIEMYSVPLANFSQTLVNMLQIQDYSSQSDEIATALVEITQYKEFQLLTSEIIRQLIKRLKSGTNELFQQIVNLLKHEEVRSTILQKHDDIFQILTNIEQSSSQKFFACTLLAEISHYKEFWPTLMSTNLMPFLSNLLQSDEEELEEEAARTLLRFLPYDELRLAISPTELVSQLSAMLEKIDRRREEIFETELFQLPVIRSTPTKSGFQAPTWMRRLRDCIPLFHARTSRLGELVNGIPKWIMPWPPVVRPSPRLEAHQDPEGLESKPKEPIENEAASLAGSLLVSMCQYDEFRPVILQEVVPSLLRMWKRRQDGLISVVTESLSKFHQYDEFRAVIPSTEIVDHLVDLLQLHEILLTDELDVLKSLIKYPECREAMLRSNMLTKLPATIRYAILSEARIVVDLLRECAEYHEFWIAKPPSDLASCFASCVSIMDAGEQMYRREEDGASWSELMEALKRMERVNASVKEFAVSEVAFGSEYSRHDFISW